MTKERVANGTSTGDAIETRWDVDTILSSEQVGQVLHGLQMHGVRLYEVCVERLGTREPECEPEVHPVMDFDISVVIEAQRLMGRLTLEILHPNEESPEYRLLLVIETVLTPKDPSVSTPNPEEMSTELGAAIWTILWPYAREYTQDLTRRMEVEIFVLPTIDQLKDATEVASTENSE